MEIRHATENDLKDMLRIYEAARSFMASHGNPHQWGHNNWPPEELLRKDILSGHSYVCVSEGKNVGTFFFLIGEDPEPTYQRIYDGAWTDSSPYGVVHRIASDKTVKGVGTFCLNWAYARCGHLRIDTHGDNTVMRNLLSKLGFIPCGTIYVPQDSDPRLAFEKSGKNRFPGGQNV